MSNAAINVRVQVLGGNIFSCLLGKSLEQRSYGKKQSPDFYWSCIKRRKELASLQYKSLSLHPEK